MTQAPEDFTPDSPERDHPGESRPGQAASSPLVPGQRSGAEAPRSTSPEPVLPQAGNGDAAIPQAAPMPPMPEPTAPPSTLPVDMLPPGAMPQGPMPGRPQGPYANAPYPTAPYPGAPHQIPPGPIPVTAMPPWPGGPVYYQPRPDRKPSRFGTILVVLLLITGSVFGGALVNGWRPGMPAAETGTIEGLAVQPGEGTVPSPGPNASEAEILAYLKEQAQLVLDAQSESLLNNSVEGWLAAYDPSLHDQMTRRFDTLTSMQVSRFDYRIASGPLEDAAGAVPLYDISIALSYCFVEPADTCKAADIVFDTRWRAGDDGLVMVEVSNSEADGPHPWEITDLVAAVGERTVTAVPLSMADRLDEALEVSEAAAVNADKWAYWEKPDRYVIYIASDDEFESWFGGFWDSEDVLGFALPLSGTVDGERQPSTYATVMGVDRTGWGYGLTSVIRHELGHAVTLWAAPSERYADDTWWMVEGVAEYIDEGELTFEEYSRARDVRDYVAQGGCETDILPPDGDDDTLAGSGKYGCGFLGVTYLIDEYGVEQFTELFGATAREGQPAVDAVQEIYGKSYAELMQEITAFIAQTV
ncbi:hypothetical protein [Glycomyces algeriensis]|uniref:Peptidase MA superfamily protein n=1 Tax=Glycomyces algeriensis TaxID=256037 RepID=A0A9W6G7J2_9ACTN|nr:hypothetical protein [Glycomyces algeriensis]MDA1366196.1 hypothetical protein [Glycomyces algeriensis]MDR7349036.1 hypothetical protein [Glycomyces algeriensis]GLI41739.1 hypothetical protein GALLR39Z86_15890 [Glycomyces algeriensis]